MKRLLAVVLLLTALGGVSVRAQEGAPLKNQDIIGLVRSNMSESTILTVIRSGRPNFNTSSSELIRLRQAGVSDTIISAMVEANASRAPASSGRTASASRGAFNPEEPILVDAGQRIPMRYLTPQMRMAARALGFGGFGQYAALQGTAASLRLHSRQPEFLVAVPNNAQPQSYYTLANFAVRRNGSREVLVGGGYISYSTGINRDRVVATTASPQPDQSSAPPGFTIYRIAVVNPLSPGEYAMVLYNSQVHVVGFFMGGADSYFDFGVD
nr:hypothetical protein [uncultured Rhodopila sp.]